MSTNTPDHDRTDALTGRESTEAQRATERTEALPATERTDARPDTERAQPQPLPERTEARPPVQRTETLPWTPPPAAYQQSPAPAAGPRAVPEVVRGPYLAPIILGLVCLAVAAAAFAQEIANWSIDWGNVGPLGIVVAGVVLVLLGALGLLSSRRRR